MRTLMLFVLLLSGLAVKAQPAADSLLIKLSDPEIIKARLLPMAQLIDSAITLAPEISMQEAQVLAMQADLSSARAAWFNIVKFKAGLTIGNGNVDVTDQTVGFQTLSTSQTTVFNFGPFVTFSIGELLQNQQRIKKANATLEQSKMQIELIERTVTRLVMDQYAEVILNAQVLSIQNKIRTDMELRLEEAKNAYAQARMSLSEYLNIEMLYNSQLIAFEKAKSDLSLSFQYLGLITGLSFEQLFIL
jgi:outer membrane protein TolC